MFAPPSPDVLAAAEEAFRACALERGREQAEIAADLRSAPTSPEGRAAWVEAFAEEWAANFIQGAREERARIAGIIQSPEAVDRPEEAMRIAFDSRLEPAEAAMLLAAGEGAELQVFGSSQDRASLVERMRASTSLAGRA